MADAKAKKVVVIAGGGTGGHIYPGIAIARALEKLHPELEVHFVGATGCLEEKIIPREKFPLHTVPVGKLHQSAGLATRLKTILKMPLAFVSAVRILFQLKPVAVLGVGGFASGPMLFVASLFGYRSVIWEPNAYPGLANRLLSRRVDECLLVFEAAGEYLHAKKTTQSGLPVRATMVPVPRDRSAHALRVLVFGGSQGARAINSLLSEAVKLGSWLEGVELVHQTGPADFERMKSAYAGAPPTMQVFEYLHDMDKRYAWADLVICRSGASTVAEICACQKAALFIPLPTAADDHQRKNAEQLARAGAARLVPDREFTGQRFFEEVTALAAAPGALEKMGEAARAFARPRAAERAAELLEQIARPEEID